MSLLYIVIFVVCLERVLSETAVMHYGHFGGLSISCDRDELISMESEQLGYSRNADCNPEPLCSVPYTLAKWYCRGMSTCEGMQVERRPLHKRTCGADFTNCLRVKYKCVKKSKLTDICSDVMYDTSNGHLASPSFPEMYPHNKNCTCLLSSSDNDHVQLETSFFMLKSSTPCKDWVQVTSDNRDVTTKCGYIPETKLYVGQEIRINFHSDQYETEMGFWMRYSGTSGGAVNIRCGKYLHVDKSMMTKSQSIRTTADNTITIMKTEPGNRLTSIPMTRPSVSPTVVTIHPDQRKNTRKEQMFKTTKRMESKTRNITAHVPDFKTNVKEFFEFSKSTSAKTTSNPSLKPNNDPHTYKKVTFKTHGTVKGNNINGKLKTNYKSRRIENDKPETKPATNEIIKKQFENKVRKLSTAGKKENDVNLKMGKSKTQENITNKNNNYPVKLSPKSGLVNEFKLNNNEGYLTMYSSKATSTARPPSAKNSAYDSKVTENKSKGMGESIIQNDVSTWTVTESPLIFYSFDQTKDPWMYSRKTTPSRTRLTTKLHSYNQGSRNRVRNKYSNVDFNRKGYQRRKITKEPDVYYSNTIDGNVTNTVLLRRHIKERVRDKHPKLKSQTDEFVKVETIYSPKNKHSNEISIRNGLPKQDNVYGNPRYRFRSNRHPINDKIRWLPHATAPTPRATMSQWQTVLMTILKKLETTQTPKQSYYFDNQNMHPNKNNMLISKSNRESNTGTFLNAPENKKIIRTVKPESMVTNSKPKEHSIIPFDENIFATGQLQTAQEHISLIDKNEFNKMTVTTMPTTTTTTTTTTTVKPRSTRKPETFTIGGSLLHGRGNPYQTIGRNRKPILFTPPSSTTTEGYKHLRKQRPDREKQYKSVTWATDNPPKELILNTKADLMYMHDLNKHRGISKEYIQDMKNKLNEKYRMLMGKTDIDMVNEVRLVDNELEDDDKDNKEMKQKENMDSDTYDKMTEYQNIHMKINSEAADRNIILKQRNDYQHKRNNTRKVIKPDVSKLSAIKTTTPQPPRKTAVVQSKIKKDSKNKDIMWVLLVIAIIGGFIFLLMIILLLYHRKRGNRTSCYRSWTSHSPLSSLAYPRHLGHSLSKSFTSTSPRRLPIIPNIAALSPASIRSANFNIHHPHDHDRSGLMSADSSSRSITPVSRQNSPMSDRPLPGLPHINNVHTPAIPCHQAIPIATQTQIGTDMCTQTNCTNYVQTDLTLASDPNDSLRKAFNRSRKASDSSASTYFGPNSPKDTSVQTYTLTTLPRDLFSVTNQKVTNDLDLNHSNISGWALANMARNQRGLIRQVSTSSSESDKKRPVKMKSKSFKLPMGGTAQNPIYPRQSIVTRNNSQSLNPVNYQHLQLLNKCPLQKPSLRSSPKAYNKPQSYIPKKQAPVPTGRPMYSQIAGKQQSQEQRESPVLKAQYNRTTLNNINAPHLLLEDSETENTSLLRTAQKDRGRAPDVILPPPQYSFTGPPSPTDNLPLPPPPLPPKSINSPMWEHHQGRPLPALPEKIPFSLTSTDTSRTSTPDQWDGETTSYDHPIARMSSFSSGTHSPDSGAMGPAPSKTGNRRKVKKLVTQQANIFNDMVHPELRQILAQRTSGQEPVEV